VPRSVGEPENGCLSSPSYQGIMYKMSERSYLILLDADARKRHHHVVSGGRIVTFMVQLEVRVKGVWKEVLRYDCEHDFVHKDCYNLQGQRRKTRIRLDYEEAVTYADEDIDENWEIYRERFLQGGFP
jgi:hypothetical protein